MIWLASLLFIVFSLNPWNKVFSTLVSIRSREKLTWVADFSSFSTSRLLLPSSNLSEVVLVDADLQWKLWLVRERQPRVSQAIQLSIRNACCEAETSTVYEWLPEWVSFWVKSIKKGSSRIVAFKWWHSFYSRGRRRSSLSLSSLSTSVPNTMTMQN